MMYHASRIEAPEPGLYLYSHGLDLVDDDCIEGEAQSIRDCSVGATAAILGTKGHQITRATPQLRRRRWRRWSRICHAAQLFKPPTGLMIGASATWYGPPAQT